MFFSTFTIFLAMLASNFLAPSFLPEDGFFSLSYCKEAAEAGEDFSFFDYFPLRGVSYHQTNIDLSAPWLSPPPERATSAPPQINSTVALSWDPRSGKVLWGKNQNRKRPLASITKLMTALVFLDTDPDWNDYYKIKPTDKREGGKIYLYWGEEVKTKDLFYASLVASANTATVALVHSSGLSEEEFLKKMNRKARSWGLRKTFFKDVTGLNSENTSSAWEIAKLTQKAFARERIKKALSLPKYEFETKGGRTKEVETTDELLKNFSLKEIEFKGGKTGYNEEAGYCLVSGFKYKDNFLISVILGAENKKDRFSLTRDLIKWTAGAYKW